MIEKHQFVRMRRQIGLIQQVGLLELADVMPDQGHGIVQVLPRQSPGRNALPGFAEEPPEPARARLVPGHAQELVPRVESHRPRPRDTVLLQVFPAVAGEQSRDEILAQARVVQAPFLFDREMGSQAEKDSGKHAGSAANRDVVRVVHLHALHPAGGGIFLRM